MYLRSKELLGLQNIYAESSMQLLNLFVSNNNFNLFQLLIYLHLAHLATVIKIFELSLFCIIVYYSLASNCYFQLLSSIQYNTIHQNVINSILFINKILPLFYWKHVTSTPYYSNTYFQNRFL